VAIIWELVICVIPCGKVMNLFGLHNVPQMSVGGAYRHGEIISQIILEINYEMKTDLPVVIFSFHLVVDFKNNFMI
jgi:hypothetical protein